jgi:hypothetical protein
MRVDRADGARDEEDDVVVIVVVIEAGDPHRIRGAGVRDRREREQHGQQQDSDRWAGTIRRRSGSRKSLCGG